MGAYLWYAEHQGECPGHQDRGVAARHGPSAVGLQRAADGVVAVHRHGHDHVGGGEHAHNLQVLDQATERIGALEALGDVPHQLWKDLEEHKKYSSLLFSTFH